MRKGTQKNFLAHGLKSRNGGSQEKMFINMFKKAWRNQ